MKTIVRLLPLILFIWVLSSCGNPQKQNNEAKYISDTKLTAVLGKWIRSDGDYTLEINNLKTDSTLDVTYLNPEPINISETQWKTEEGHFYFFVKFDDEGYPGSYYSLGYISEEDKLYGFYFQALQQQQYDVVFDRK